MKRHWYTNVHAKSPSNIWQKFAENSRDLQSATGCRTEVTFRAQDPHFVSRRSFSKFHKVLHLPRKVTLTFSKYCTCHGKWHLTFTKYCACHENWPTCLIQSRMKRHWQCAGQQMSPSKHCACHAKWRPNIDLHQLLRLPRKVTLGLNQVVFLPWKMTFDLHQILRLPRKNWYLTSPSTAPATKSWTTCLY